MEYDSLMLFYSLLLGAGYKSRYRSLVFSWISLCSKFESGYFSFVEASLVRTLSRPLGGRTPPKA